jgi:phosphomannomutase
MQNKPKLMAFDLDGTLAESKQPLTAQMASTLARLTQTMPMAVMSGAAFTQFEKQFLTALPADTNLSNLYIFPTNAAQCYVYKSGAWSAIYDFAFTPEEVTTIRQTIAASLADVPHTIPTQLWGEQIEDRGAQVSYSVLGQQAPVEEKTKWKAEHNNERIALHATLVQRLPELSISMGGLTTIDITRKGITKAFGIQKLSEMTGISISDMLYVGDALDPGGNDAVVIPTGVPTHQVSNPADTATLIEEILQ